MPSKSFYWEYNNKITGPTSPKSEEVNIGSAFDYISDTRPFPIFSSDQKPLYKYKTETSITGLVLEKDTIQTNLLTLDMSPRMSSTVNFSDLFDPTMKKQSTWELALVVYPLFSKEVSTLFQLVKAIGTKNQQRQLFMSVSFTPSDASEGELSVIWYNQSKEAVRWQTKMPINQWSKLKLGVITTQVTKTSYSYETTLSVNGKNIAAPNPVAFENDSTHYTDASWYFISVLGCDYRDNKVVFKGYVAYFGIDIIYHHINNKYWKNIVYNGLYVTDSVSSISTGTIVGIIVGILLLLTAILFLYLKRKKSKIGSQTSTEKIGDFG